MGGEAALMGAAIGGGTSLLSGKDPLKGALLGGLGGAAFGGFNPTSGIAPSVEDLAAKEITSGGAGVTGMPELGYTWNQASNMLEPATAERLAGAMSGAPGTWNVGPSTDAMTQFFGSDMAGGGGGTSVAGSDAGIAGLPTGPGAAPGANPPIASVADKRFHERTNNPFLKDPLAWMQENPMKTAAGALGIYTLANMGNMMKPNYMTPYQPPTAQQYGLGAKLSPNYRPTVAMQAGGSVEQMSNANAIGQNTGFPQADIVKGAYATPWQTPISRNMIEGSGDTAVDPITGQMKFADGGGISGLMQYAKGGGISDLGGYSDGGRMLKGPGDGMSDSIPASIDGKQPARLADGEFVVPADVVSHLGNGSTDAGAKQLYRMMDKVRTARTGRKSQSKQIKPNKYMPA